MHKYLDEYEKAPPGRVEDALELFPFREISAEEYAARESRKWVCFGFDNFVYEDPDLNEWIHALGDILFTPGAVREARQKYVTSDEMEEVERQEREAL